MLWVPSVQIVREKDVKYIKFKFVPLGEKRSPETGLKISANNFNRTKIFILNTDDKIIIGTRTFIQTSIDKKFMKFDYLINLGIKEIGIRKNFKQHNFVIRKGLR